MTGLIPLPPQLLPFLPELYLAFATILLLLFGLFRSPHVRPVLLVLTLIVMGKLLWLVIDTTGQDALLFHDLIRVTLFTQIIKAMLVAGALILLLSGWGWLRGSGGKPYEFLLLTLFSLLGLLGLVSANDFMSLYLTLELSSLCLYVLASFHRDDVRSSEAGLKYFILGALASGMMLLGMAWVYSYTGTTNFTTLHQLFASQHMGAAGVLPLPAVLAGMAMILVGLCFKLSAVPFHMWTPDVYEGSPTLVTGLFATLPKLAAFAILTRLLWEPLHALMPYWQPVLMFAAAASMLVGAVAGIAQTNFKRLIAYSSIGNIGFLLMALAAGSAQGVQAALVYWMAYLATTFTTFAVLLQLRTNEDELPDLRALSGLARAHPWLAFALSAAMFSLAGIPPLAGFFGKWYVLLAAVQAGQAWLAVFGVITSVVACYYYIRVVKWMYFDEPAVQALVVKQSLPVQLAALLSAAATAAFCLLPQTAMDVAAMALKGLVP